MNRIVLAGYGKMGEAYVKNLQELGTDVGDIAVIDTNEDRLRTCEKQHPHILVSTQLERVCETFRPHIGFVLVNTPGHLPVMQTMQAQGIRNLFVEKPLMTSEQLHTAQNLLKNSERIGVGYLINFSQAFAQLLSLIQEHRLRIHEAIGVWGKDRRGDTRPTMGDFEDETTHVLMTILRTLSSHERIRDIAIDRASLLYHPFAEDVVQEQAHTADSSFPLKPNAASSIELTAQTPRGDVPIFVRSSFTYPFGQARTVLFHASYPPHAAPDTTLQMHFDQKGKDILRVKSLNPSREIQTWEFPAQTKLRDQIAAFLSWSNGGQRDPRLVDGEEALRLVELHGRTLKAT